MGSRPMLHAMRKAIEELGGDEWLSDQLANGRSVGKVASDMGVSRRMLYRWRDQPGPQREERQRLWAEAIRTSGEARANGGLDDLVDLKEKAATGMDVRAAVGLANYRQWLARRRDPSSAGIELNFSVGELHLSAVADATRAPAR